MPKLKTAIFGLILLLTILARPLMAEVSVIFPPENTVDGPRIILGDVANVAGDSEGDLPLASLISAIDLGAAPLAGQDLVLRRRQIELKLAASGAPLADIRWLIPDEVKLTGSGQAFDDNLIKKIVTEYLDRAEPYLSGSYEILSLSSSTLPAFPHGKIEYRFSPQPSSNPSYLTGVIYFTVDGREAGRLRITAQIDLRVPAVVVVRDLSRGHVLTEEDLSESMVAFAQAKGALTVLESAVGQTLKTNLRTGAPVRDRDLIATSMIKRGDIVTIIAQSGGLKISALGQARQDGALGQTITVLNQDSKKTISAKVIGPGLVQVVF
ncbi:MAG: flagellar basal body P-ring formation chaperone FlgA [Deltaproteobacteria bacterium]|jgi:flagella basal body P-ring formation protein FlgA|nr:flagellar basal body P-ring formation chaperone FlgA [Deltaproteobacteria bacterium]